MMTKPPLFLIHGMWCTGEAWSRYRGYFETKGYEVVAPTLRLHDASQNDAPNPDLGTTSLLDYARDLEAAITSLDTPPVLIGHSMGGLLAQILAARGVGRAAIFLTPASPAGIVALTPSVVKTFRRVLTTWGFWKRPTFPTFEEACYAVYNLVPEADRQDEYANLVHESGRAAAEIAFWLLDRQRATTVDETKITIPTLTVAGTQDHITPASVVRKIAKKYRRCGGDFKEFPNHAHWVLGEPEWEEVADYCLHWTDDTLKRV